MDLCIYEKHNSFSLHNNKVLYNTIIINLIFRKQNISKHNKNKIDNCVLEITSIISKQIT